MLFSDGAGFSRLANPGIDQARLKLAEANQSRPKSVIDVRNHCPAIAVPNVPTRRNHDRISCGHEGL